MKKIIVLATCCGLAACGGSFTAASVGDDAGDDAAADVAPDVLRGMTGHDAAGDTGFASDDAASDVDPPEAGLDAAEAAVDGDPADVTAEGSPDAAADVATEGGDAGHDAADAAVMCVTDLSGVGTGDFSISFHLVTTSTKYMALVNQRNHCDNIMLWDVYMDAAGMVRVDLADSNTSITLDGLLPINDGLDHTVVVRRTNAVLTETIDGSPAGTANSAANLQALAALQVGNDPCVGVNGMVVLSGTLTKLCLTK